MLRLRPRPADYVVKIRVPGETHTQVRGMVGKVFEIPDFGKVFYHENNEVYAEGIGDSLGGINKVVLAALYDDGVEFVIHAPKKQPYLWFVRLSVLYHQGDIRHWRGQERSYLPEVDWTRRTRWFVAPYPIEHVRWVDTPGVESWERERPKKARSKNDPGQQQQTLL